MAKLPTWRSLSKCKYTNIEYLRGFNIVCIVETGRVFFDYRGAIVGEFLGDCVRLSEDATEEAQRL